MTLEFFRLLDGIDRAAQAIASQRDEYERLAREARDRLDRFSTRLDLLHSRVQAAQRGLGGTWRGAGPLGEPIGLTFDPPAEVPPVRHIIATDGSQIFPDRHGIAHYALVNIGAIHIRPGSGEPPDQQTFPDLIFGDRLRDDEKAEPLQAADISRERDMQELSKLVELSARQASGTVALMDSAVLLWMLQPDPEAELLNWFVDRLVEARAAGVLLAGYVDRPGSRGVAELLALAPLDESSITRENEALRYFKDMPDRAIFHSVLKPGQRSALFASISPFNHKLAHRGEDLRVAFFYVNVGTGSDPAIARVETPCWVANDPIRLGQLHNAIWEQCRTPGRYPYVLARAHEAAVVTQAQKAELEEMLARAMLAQGLAPAASAKSVLKSLTAG
jgi:hypothetical protein